MKSDFTDTIRSLAAEVDTIAPEDPRDYMRTDMGNGRRFARDHAGDVVYVHPWGWRVYHAASGTWRYDDQALMRMAKATVKGIYAESGQSDDADERKAIARHAVKSEAARALKAMIEMAQSELALKAEPAEFDRDPYLLNCQNGVIDLRTGDLWPHDPDYRVTKMTGTIYDPQATCPTWDAHLRRILPDETMIAFLKRLLGYCLTGVTKEQIIAVWHGTGANGKSVTEEAIRTTMGDYATGADFRSFTVTRAEGPRNDLARLAGARFVTASESNAKSLLDEALIKQATGGEPLTVRFLHQEHFEYVPQFKLALLTNHKPEIRGTDTGIWRRIRLVPFDVTLPEAEWDRDIDAKLRAELPGVLAWMVRGCLEWQKQGLDPPQAVCEATAGYRAEMDVIATFLTECTTVDEMASVPALYVYRAYQSWSRRAGENEMTQRAFNAALREHSVDFGEREAGTRRLLCWGIRLAKLPNDEEA